MVAVQLLEEVGLVVIVIKHETKPNSVATAKVKINSDSAAIKVILAPLIKNVLLHTHRASPHPKNEQ